MTSSIKGQHALSLVLQGSSPTRRGWASLPSIAATTMIITMRACWMGSGWRTATRPVRRIALQ